jgi:hypothetical protein
MARVLWDQVGDRRFESGVSNVVLYVENGNGVPWNGVTSIDDDVDTSIDPVYFDGVKFEEIVSIGDTHANIKAFTFPDEFLECQGTVEDQAGFYVMNQPPKRFSLAYRTEVGDDISGQRAFYKLHVLYNLLAIPTSTSRATINDTPEAVEFEWELTSLPTEFADYRPTSQLMLDSRKVDSYLMSDIEDILYGSADNEATLPSLKNLSAFIRKWNRLIIVDNGDGTWTAASPIEPDPYITLNVDGSFSIDTDTATYLDANTYTIESTDKNTEDV